MFNLQPPRHISTLPENEQIADIARFRNVPQAAVGRRSKNSENVAVLEKQSTARQLVVVSPRPPRHHVTWPTSKRDDECLSFTRCEADARRC
jgi:hypothetical protein